MASATFSDAVDYEAAWLSVTTDALPVLVDSAGGPFQVLQARWTRTPNTRKRSLYVLRAPSGTFRYTRFASQRSDLTTNILLRLIWAVSAGTGKVETDQLAFEQAIDAVIARVAGPLGDKSHNGAFLNVAETGIAVEYDDPEQSLGGGILRAQITYSAQIEINN